MVITSPLNHHLEEYFLTFSKHRRVANQRDSPPRMRKLVAKENRLNFGIPGGLVSCSMIPGGDVPPASWVAM